MIIQSDFLHHWKTRALANQIGMEAALTALIALWSHCERRRAWEFRLTPLILAGICHFRGTPEELMTPMVELGFLDPSSEESGEAGWYEVHDWSRVNASLIVKWWAAKGSGWHKRGYIIPKTRSSDPSQDVSKDGSIREEKRRED